ncbi:hypothetical protein FISHEDRAFT_76588 [Fistulina hepatica ATCC 64428]|uniref:Uncharacterized protein n=1 Tax=Fistulina hepatica ATCC 64428 TaxID=1128425 RepID=A0A0D7A672_9AGAR|nr:hypothetical protein FISHEDRAFT_76588 [Fistulina hepatica ATCC 64428]
MDPNRPSLARSKHGRNRLSVILQMATGSVANRTKLSRRPNPGDAPPISITPPPGVSSSQPSLASPRIPFSPSPIRGNADPSPPINELVTVPVSPTEARSPGLLKKARKFSRFFTDVTSLGEIENREPTGALSVDAKSLSSNRMSLPPSPAKSLFPALHPDDNALDVPPSKTSDKRSSIASIQSKRLSANTYISVEVSLRTSSPIPRSADCDVSDIETTPTTPAPPVPADEQLHRKRLEKLSHFLGEKVPSEIDLGSSSTSRRLNRSRTCIVRKRSVDGGMQSAVSLVSGQSNAKESDSGSRGSSVIHSSPLKRSRSMWGVEHPQLSAESDFNARYQGNFGSSSEKQRIIALKRMRKVAQVFGQAPPVELIQIHDIPRVDKRESVSTVISVSSLLLPSPSSARSRPVSTSSSISGLIKAESEMGAGASTSSHGASSSPVSSTAPLTGARPASDHAHSNSEPDWTSFRDRRRRAAKLSQFFGVSHQDITDAQLNGPVPPVPALPERPTHYSPEVDVFVAGRSFWGEGKVRPADIEDVRGRLREMRSQL